MAAELSMLKPGEAGTVIAIHADEDLYHRLAALGLRVGKRVELIRRASFSGPLHLRIGTTDLMMRGDDARKVEINHPA